MQFISSKSYDLLVTMISRNKQMCSSRIMQKGPSFGASFTWQPNISANE